MKKFTFFSRVAAVLLMAMMTIPLWAAYAPDVNPGHKADNYAEETINLSHKFKLGEQFNFQEVFPDLPTRFQYDGGIPSLEGYNVIALNENPLGQNEDLDNLYEVELTDGYCFKLNSSADENNATITLWHLDTVMVQHPQYPSIQEMRFTKMTTYNITLTA